MVGQKTAQNLGSVIPWTYKSGSLRVFELEIILYHKKEPDFGAIALQTFKKFVITVISIIKLIGSMKYIRK